MKKIIIFLMTMLFLVPFHTVYAEENVLGTGLYVTSEAVDPTVVEYAYNEEANVLLSLREILGNELYEFNTTTRATYGTPFKLNEQAYFPILIDGKVVALLAVFEQEDGYAWSMSGDFSEGLNQIAPLTSAENPATLYTMRGNVYARIGDMDYQLSFYPEMEEWLTEYAQTSSEDEETIGIQEVNPATEGVSVGEIIIEERAATSRYLGLDRKEQQGDQDWCAAFVAAQILRYKGKNVSTLNVVFHFHPNQPYEKVKRYSLSHDQVIAYARIKGLRPIKVGRTLSFTEVRKQIDTNRPMYLSMYGTGGYRNSRHAMVLRGYDVNKNIYSVWNPWDTTKYVVMSANSKSVAVNGGGFVWDSTIYNW